ncbi:uncharacterized protein APUU_21466A [Aspergillus puulaauensis]|uniref:Rhodopsin domain-containing protein n=1 Tax=Aspergillus puulaauensis TaxID=1220207 RepID=A0A7R7XGU3_9EURO|nr:uncharacterized protein APUU_21466A [Aspergillus puulaauensis]BCS21034.1 hypothetical protein APUU_21466A [Aspergillus puulaauensis]
MPCHAKGGCVLIQQPSVEDYVMSATFLIYTSLLVLIQVSSRYASNLMDPADYDQVLSDPQEVRNRIIGSKVVIGLEQCMLFSTWGVKTCMLTLFWRLTKNLPLHLYVKIVVWYVAVGFVVIMVTYYAIYCRPFSQYWAMPVENMQCATYQHYSITQAVFNISSDAAMLAIPVPLLIKAQMKKTKKVLLVCIMSLGVFTIVAAILNKAFNFASPLTTTYQIWYIREASTSIYVANLVCLWPLLRKICSFAATQRGSDPNRAQASQSDGITFGSSQSRPSTFRDRAWLIRGFGDRRVIEGLRDSGGSEETNNKTDYSYHTEGADAVQLEFNKGTAPNGDLEAGGSHNRS